MKKTITIFTLANAELEKEVSFSTNKQALEHQAILSEFGIETELVKSKKVIEL